MIPFLVSILALSMSATPASPRDPAEAQVRVRVVGSTGKPVQEVPVRVLWKNPFHAVSQGVTRTSDAQGVVAFTARELRRVHGEGVTTLEAVIASRDPVEVTVDADTLEDGTETPLELRLPPFGQVRVYLEDPQGDPVSSIDGVFLTSMSGKPGSKPRFRADAIEAVVRRGRPNSGQSLPNELPISCTCRARAEARA